MTPAHGTAEQRGSVWPSIVATMVMLGSYVLALAYGLVNVMASDPCGPSATELICTPRGQRLTAEIPAAGGLVTVVIAVFGAYVWPRRARLAWPVTGIVVILVLAYISRTIAQTLP